MRVLEANELERLVRRTFPAKPGFAVGPDLGLTPNRDRELDDWLGGGLRFVGLYPLLNRLCRAGALAPGTYAVTRPS